MLPKFQFKNDRLKETETHLISNIDYYYNDLREVNNDIQQNTSCENKVVEIVQNLVKLEFTTLKKIPKIGVMLVGIGGNNGTTLTGVILANRYKLNWESKRGIMEPNYYGSMVMSSTVSLGTYSKCDKNGNYPELCVPLCKLVPTVNPNDIEIDGWDINSFDLNKAMKRAEVFDIDLQKKLAPYMKDIKPRKSIFNPEFVASNQKERADNILNGSLNEQIEQIRSDICDFKIKKQLDKIIIIWTASTERFCDVKVGINDTADNLLLTIKKNNKNDISPSTLFGIASVLEGCDYINGSPQNTFVPGFIELAQKHNVHIAGDDFKTGQTKVKSMFVDFLIKAGIKPKSIVSYNHLGNNDGYNLNSPSQFRSKEISKSGVIDDIIDSNCVLYNKGEQPDHCIVIKYIPFVGDSKRAMDEYTSEICMNGLNTMVIHNTCEDSLLASTVMLDLILLCELLQRINVRIISYNNCIDNGKNSEKLGFHTILSFLSILLKSPCVTPGEPLINAFSRQRNMIESLFLSCIGLQPSSEMNLEHKLLNFKQFMKN